MKRGPHNGRYILRGKIPVPCVDLMEWARWYENAHRDRIVIQELIGDYEVSTVFLGLDHSWADDTPPLLFETMVFHKNGGPVDDAPVDRAPTWELALETHARAVVWVREQLN
jgi:hypothetical protein